MLTDNFSVLLSIYFKEKSEYFDEAMTSLWDHQYQKPAEIILVKDGPLTDDLEKKIEFWSKKLGQTLKIINLKHNVGLGNALNEGLKHCQYELVARMDTDDVCLPNRFKEQLSFMQKNPEIAILGSTIQEFEHDISLLTSTKTVPLTYDKIIQYVTKRSPFNHPSVMYRKSIIQSLGGYHHHLFMEDYNLWLRAIAAGHKVANLEPTLVYMRAGHAMLSRRRGWVYVKSEWQMVRLKKRIGIQGYCRSIPIFVLRALPRLLPSTWIASIYRHLRKR